MNRQNLQQKSGMPTTIKMAQTINNEHIDTSENINMFSEVSLHMYNLIEYSNNYPDTSGSSWQFKGNESPVTNDGNSDNAYHR